MKLTRPNSLPVAELRSLLSKKESKVVCWHCDQHKATDVHHLNDLHHDNRPENLEPWCKRCHNEHHGISDRLTDFGLVARQFDAIQVQRIAMNNRLVAYKNLGYEAEIAHDVYRRFLELEKDVAKELAQMVKEEPIYTYLSSIKGVGPSLSVSLISEIGDPSRFATISALWSYAGLDVRDGKAPKRQKGVKANWNQRLRMVVIGRLVPQFIKLKGKDAFGRKLYERYKAFYTERDGDKLTKGHVENRARRKVAKVFLSCLWVAWRRIKGLPVTLPYAFDKLAHTHIITPEEWAGDDWFEKVAA